MDVVGGAFSVAEEIGQWCRLLPEFSFTLEGLQRFLGHDPRGHRGGKALAQKRTQGSPLPALNVPRW